MGKLGERQRGYAVKSGTSVQNMPGAAPDGAVEMHVIFAPESS
jgi:hypothetical protein